METSSVATVTKKKFDVLLEAARAAANPAEAIASEDAVFRALLELTVYAHVPAEHVPPDRIRFIQFVRPDNAQTVLPFFSDREQAEEVAAVRQVGIVAMTGRRLLELTRGATLMLNPNRDRVALYPPEVTALLDGRSLGHFFHEICDQEEQVGFCPPSVPTAALVQVLQALFAREAAVRAAYLVEMHRGADLSDVSLLLTLVVTLGSEERIVQLTSLELNSLSPVPRLAVTLSCKSPDELLPEHCRHGIQFYGT